LADTFSGSEHQMQEGSMLLKFLVETRLKSESFKPLLHFLVFLVENLRQNKFPFSGLGQISL